MGLGLVTRPHAGHNNLETSRPWDWATASHGREPHNLKAGDPWVL